MTSNDNLSRLFLKFQDLFLTIYLKKFENSNFFRSSIDIIFSYLKKLEN